MSRRRILWLRFSCLRAWASKFCNDPSAGFWGLTPPIQAASAFIQFRRDKPTPLHSIAARRLIRGQREAECVTLLGASHFIADFGYLPLLHTLVEERAGERRSFFDSPLPFPLPACAGRGDENPALSAFLQETEMRPTLFGTGIHARA